MALIAWLKDKDRKRPSRSNDGAAIVKSKDAGSVVLAGRGGDEACIVWGPGQPQAHIVSGRYTVRTTRIERKQDDDHWFLSSCGPAGHKPKTIKLKRGTNTFKLDDTAHFEAVVRGWNDGRLQLGFAIRGKDNRGLSVYKNDRRVPVTYRVLSKKGKVLAHGRMNYG